MAVVAVVAVVAAVLEVGRAEELLAGAAATSLPEEVRRIWELEPGTTKLELEADARTTGTPPGAEEEEEEEDATGAERTLVVMCNMIFPWTTSLELDRFSSRVTISTDE